MAINDPYSSHMSSPNWITLKKQEHFTSIAPAFILLLALLVRLYRINSPLWLDEIYGYKLAKLGFDAIIQNSWTDPHPPLYYLLGWVTSGFGSVHSEIGWRWIPVVCGVAAVAVTGRMVKDLT